MISFTVIICNYNGKKYIKDCLDSVIRTNYPKFELLIIDDGSIDGSLGIINRYQKKTNLRLIQNSTNLGLVASRNKAIVEATGEVLVFLDNDTAVDQNWLKGLAKTFNKNPKIGAAQCLIFDFHHRDLIQEVGMKLVPLTGFGITLGRGEKDHSQYKKPQEIISLGAALAVRKDVAEKLRGFDEELFHYTDDLDFSWRVWIAGYKIITCPDAKVYHYTKEHQPDFKLYSYLTKNSLRMITKNYELRNVVKYLPVSILISALGALNVLITQKSLRGVSGVLIGYLWYLFILPDTFYQRSLIQVTRRFSDRVIMEKVMVKDGIKILARRYLKL